MGYFIRCMSCRKKTPWEPSKGYPKACIECGYDFGEERADDDVVMPFISAKSEIARSHDTFYRQMETASEQRVADVAAITGASEADLSHMKITDLRSTKHPGSVAAPPLPSELQNLGGFQNVGNEWAGAIKSGLEPNAGARAMTRIQRQLGRG